MWGEGESREERTAKEWPRERVDRGGKTESMGREGGREVVCRENVDNKKCIEMGFSLV